jgi:hypothetical protein
MTATATETIAELRDKATANWRAWAHALATTGKLPPTRELVDAAGLLGRNVDALEQDAALVREHAAATDLAMRWRAECDRAVEKRGPIEELREKIRQAEANLEALRKGELVGYSESLQAGLSKAKADRIASNRPDLFDAAE